MPGRWKAWIAPVGDLWTVVSLLLPTAAVAAIFEGLSRSYGVTHSQHHGLTVAPAFRILGGFLFAVFGMSIRSVKRARMKIADSLFACFLSGSVESFKEEGGLVRIEATIFVECSPEKDHSLVSYNES
jgi:hypothetical protein